MGVLRRIYVCAHASVCLYGRTTFSVRVTLMYYVHKIMPICAYMGICVYMPSLRNVSLLYVKTWLSTFIIIIIIRQPFCPVVGRRSQHVVSKWPCLVLSSAISLQYLSRSSLYRLAGLPCRLFLSYGLQVVTREVHRSSLRRLIFPAQDHFIFLTVLIISMTFVLSISNMLVFLYPCNVMLSILLSIFVCAIASLFCACLVSDSVSRSTWLYISTLCECSYSCCYCSCMLWLLLYILVL